MIPPTSLGTHIHRCADISSCVTPSIHKLLQTILNVAGLFAYGFFAFRSRSIDRSLIAHRPTQKSLARSKLHVLGTTSQHCPEKFKRSSVVAEYELLVHRLRISASA